jgi:hypothetical protein
MNLLSMLENETLGFQPKIKNIVFTPSSSPIQGRNWAIFPEKRMWAGPLSLQ